VQKYYYVKRSNSYQRKKNPLPVFLSFVIVLFLLVSSVIYLFSSSSKVQSREVLAETAASVIILTPTAVPEKKYDNEMLADVVMNELEGSKASYSAVIKNFKTGQEFYLNEQRRYTAASLYKLWTMTRVFELIDEGELEVSKKLTADVKTLNSRFKISSDSAELSEGTISLTVGKALERMITISDNYSALLLTSTVKLSTIQPMLDKYGFVNTSINSKTPLPLTTASDVALFFEKLYKKELINTQRSEEMLELLKGQQIVRKLPRNLPDDVVIAHKTGELDGYSHDAGIVFTPSGDYLIVLMSKSTQPAQAEIRLANISQAVYEFFIKQ